MPDRPGPLARFALLVYRAARWVGRAIRGQVVKRVGGPARARVITLFAFVLALNGADSSTVGAIAPQLESALHINNTDLGLLSSVSLLVGAVFTIPVGLLVDRTKRTMQKYLEDEENIETQTFKGNPKIVCQYLKNVKVKDIKEYYKLWTDKLIKSKKKAYPNDEFSYGVNWQAIDFILRSIWIHHDGNRDR